MKFSSIYPLIIASISWSCFVENEPKFSNKSEKVEYQVKIERSVVIGLTDLGEGRVNDLDEQYYFFIGIFEFDEDVVTSNPYIVPLLYASGGYSHLPEEIMLSLYTDKKYTIQTLVIKKANGYGIAHSTYDHHGTIFDRLHLGYDSNTQLPAILCDSISYNDPWLGTNSGVLLFFDGYMFDNQDSTTIAYRGPLSMNAYYETQVVHTTSELDEILIRPERTVFGIEVNVVGLTETNYVELYLGRSQSSPFKISQANNGEIFIFPPDSYESEVAYFNLKVTAVNVDELGNEISEIIYLEEFHQFPLLKKTVLDITLGESSGSINNSRIILIEKDLEPGDIINIDG